MSNLKFKATVEIGDKEVDVDVDADFDPPDPSVGIMSGQISINHVRTEPCCGDRSCKGNRDRLDDLTEEQIQQLEERAFEIMRERVEAMYDQPDSED